MCFMSLSFSREKENTEGKYKSLCRWIYVSIGPRPNYRGRLDTSNVIGTKGVGYIWDKCWHFTTVTSFKDSESCISSSKYEIPPKKNQLMFKVIWTHYRLNHFDTVATIVKPFEGAHEIIFALKCLCCFLKVSLKTHETNIKELAATKTDSCVTSNHLCKNKKGLL